LYFQILVSLIYSFFTTLQHSSFLTHLFVKFTGSTIECVPGYMLNHRFEIALLTIPCEFDFRSSTCLSLRPGSTLLIRWGCELRRRNQGYNTQWKSDIKATAIFIPFVGIAPWNDSGFQTQTSFSCWQTIWLVIQGTCFQERSTAILIAS
jgi:hypothetical protein